MNAWAEAKLCRDDPAYHLNCKTSNESLWSDKAAKKDKSVSDEVEKTKRQTAQSSKITAWEDDRLRKKLREKLSPNEPNHNHSSFPRALLTYVRETLHTPPLFSFFPSYSSIIIIVFVVDISQRSKKQKKILHHCRRLFSLNTIESTHFFVFVFAFTFIHSCSSLLALSHLIDIVPPPPTPFPCEGRPK